MKAWIIREPGGPDHFSLEEVDRPTPRPGWVLIRIRAFGLNRSEWFTRNGDSPSVNFPRVLGIECVGEVVDSGGLDIEIGSTVASIMGGMGRDFDGSYAEYTLVPHSCVFPLSTTLPWEKLAALPEMLQTTHGSLHIGLEIDRAESILIRGGTSSIGMAALALAIEMLKDAGADEVWVDDGTLERQLKDCEHRPFDRVLELIGTTTLLDSLRCVRSGGIVCMTGILGGKWTLEAFEPMGDIPTGVKLTSYSEGSSDISTRQLQHYVELVEKGKIMIQTGPVFKFEELVQAHELMDANQAGGKIVVLGKQ